MSISDRFAVIDIGSNSIRLVVYGGPLRAPVILFNEKVMAGLGRGVAATGSIAQPAWDTAIAVLWRFHALTAVMDVVNVRAVATAAVRQAENGAAFLAAVRDLGLDVERLAETAEAVAAAHGVISSFAAPDGVVADLGGGSLELARVCASKISVPVSVPLGVLRAGELRAKGRDALGLALGKLLGDQKWAGVDPGLPLYLVGGSWRALARVHMHQLRYPLPILHHYTMPAAAGARMVRTIAQLDLAPLRARGIVSGSRIASLPAAAALLEALIRRLKPSELIVSAAGLREGLLFETLSPVQAALDPLIVGARAEGLRQGRFGDHGDALFDWISPLFAHESAEEARLRHAACLLGDLGWGANPDFRAERGLDAALHGHWLALDARGRAMLGQALFSAFGGGMPSPDPLPALASQTDLARARCWGLAIRLAQRLSGGIGAPLDHSRLTISGGKVRLKLDPDVATLKGETVERRLKQLSEAIAGLAAISPA